MIKSGLKTTELAANILNNLAAAFLGVSGILDPKWAALFGLLSNVAYMISRGLAKSGTAQVVTKE